MFEINGKQIEFLGSRQEEIYEERLIEFLQINFSNAAHMDPAELRPPIHELVQKAKQYGLESEYQGCVYVMAAWIFGLDFDVEFPAAQEVLTITEMPAREKADWLAEWTQTMLDTLTAREA